MLLRRFTSTQQQQWRIRLIDRKTPVVRKTKTCQDCGRVISADAKICQFCLTEVNEHPASGMDVLSQTENAKQLS